MANILEAMSGECLSTEEACADFLYRLRWPNGFSCPGCSHHRAYKISTRRLPLYECADCGHQASLTAGTVMEGSRTPLGKWFTALKLISQPEQGISALSLSRILAVTYKTAWTMLHKIRYSMGAANSTSQLAGIVIVHDAWYGRPHNPTAFRHPQETPLLVGASMIGDNATRIVIQMVPTEHLNDRLIRPSGATAFIEQNVAPNAYVGECHIKRYISRKLKRAYPLFLTASSWINTTFHGLGRKHLQAYLDEFCCRTNLIFEASPVFETICRFCTLYGTITYSQLIMKKVDPVAVHPLLRRPAAS